MIQFIIIGFFVCLGVKAAMDVYDSAKKIILSDELKQGIKDGAHKLKDEVDEHLLHKDKESQQQTS